MEEITVNELCERAIVGRGTFYKHFSDKYDFFSFVLGEMFGHYLEEAESGIDNSDPASYYVVFFKAYIQFVETNREYFGSLTSSSMTAVMLFSTSDTLSQKLETHFQKNIEEGYSLCISPTAAARFLTGEVIFTIPAKERFGIMKQKKEGPFCQMGRAEVTRRVIFLCISMFIMALGVSFSIQADLGTSPISSFPYVCSLVFPLTVGEATIILHCVLILLQILILRRSYQLIQLIQLPIAILFGLLTDLTLSMISGINPANYGMRWVCCCVGIVLIAIGVSMEVTSRITTLAGEGFSLAVCQVSRIKFPTMKVIFDVSLVALACLTSLIGLHSIQGVREGTLAAAIFVGLLTRRINPLMERLEQRILCSHPQS